MSAEKKSPPPRASDARPFDMFESLDVRREASEAKRKRLPEPETSETPEK